MIRLYFIDLSGKSSIGSGVDDLLFYVPPTVCGGSVFVLVLVCITLCPF